LEDECDIEGIRDLWSEDCRIDYGPGRGVVVGRQAFLDQLAKSIAQCRWTHHQLGASRVEIDGDCATAMTPFLGWLELNSGQRVWAAARYYDELRRTVTGRWQITFRRLVFTGSEDASTAQNWTWLDRKLPTRGEH
jgi:ketosteroid isomerase-like protein